MNNQRYSSADENLFMIDACFMMAVLVEIATAKKEGFFIVGSEGQGVA
jgi:hypothetical protein